jgi:hypothetical protein
MPDLGNVSANGVSVAQVSLPRARRWHRLFRQAMLRTQCFTWFRINPRTPHRDRPTGAVLISSIRKTVNVALWKTVPWRRLHTVSVSSSVSIWTRPNRKDCPRESQVTLAERTRPKGRTSSASSAEVRSRGSGSIKMGQLMASLQVRIECRYIHRTGLLARHTTINVDISRSQLRLIPCQPFGSISVPSALRTVRVAPRKTARWRCLHTLSASSAVCISA